MSTFHEVLHTLPPNEQLNQLTYRRDELLRAAGKNRQAAQLRLNELIQWKFDGALDEDYDIEQDHRIALLLDGAERWEAEAGSIVSRIETMQAQLHGLGRQAGPARGSVKQEDS